jgi:hypothetical protein
VCVFDGTYYKITTTNYISKTSLYTTFRMYPLGPWLLKILMFALLVTCEIATHGKIPEMTNIPQCCSMFNVDFYWLSLQMPLEQEIDDDAKQMANESQRGTWWCRVWTHVCQHCSLWWSSFQWHIDLIFDNQPHTIAQSYWLIEITQQQDWHAHFEFELMICDIVELQSVQKFHQI